MTFDPHYTAMLNTLHEVQATMMQNWIVMVQSAAAKPLAPLNQHAFQSQLEAWQNTVQNGIRMMTLHTDPAVREVAEKIFTSQVNMLRFIELTSQVWMHVAIALHNGDDWESVLQHQLGQTRKQWLETANSAVYTTSSHQELWQTFITEGCALTAFLPEALKQKMLVSYAVHTHKGASFIDMATLHWESYPSSIGQFLETPSLDDLQRVYESLQQSFAVWTQMHQAIEAYHHILIDTWLNAYGTLLGNLGKLAQEGDAVESVRDFLNRWATTADEAFKQTFLTKPFAQAQSHLVNTVMMFRQKQLHLSDSIMKLYGLPTRSELDEAHRRIYELRKEMKALKRQLAAQSS